MLNYDHIIFIIMENTDYSSIIGNTTDAPYINNTLLPLSSSLTNMAALDHPSLPNYLALISGSEQGASGVDYNIGPADFHATITATNLVDRMEAAGVSWKAYMEAMPSNWYTSNTRTMGDTGGNDFAANPEYQEHHNPFVYFTSNNDSNTNTRLTKIVPYTQFATDLAVSGGGGVPKFAWITPEMDHDMHDALSASVNAIKAGDNFLSGLIGSILTSDAYTKQNTLVILTWDENSGTAGNKIATLLLGQNVLANHTSGTSFTHYNALATVRQGLGGLANITTNDNVAIFDVFSLAVNVSDSSATTDVISQMLVRDFVNTSNSSAATDVVLQILVRDFVNVFDSSAVTDAITKMLQILTISVFDSSTVADVTGFDLLFDLTTSSYVDVPDSSSLDITGDITVEAWAKPNTLNHQQIQSVVFKEADFHNSNERSYEISFDGIDQGTANQFRAGVYSGSSQGLLIDTTTVVSAGSWYHIVFTRSGTTTTLYTNGTQVATGTFSGLLTTNIGHLAIGREGSLNAAYFSGDIKEVRIYSRAISSSEVTAHYNNGSGKPGTLQENGLAAGWHFDEGTGTVAHDFSGNNNTGTLLGTALPVWTSNTTIALPQLVQVFFPDSVFDSSTVTDVPTAEKVFLVSVSDSSAVTDVLVWYDELVFVSERTTVEIIGEPILSDSSAAIDVVVQIQQTFFLNVFDASQATESITISVGTVTSLAISASDSSQVTEGFGNALRFNGSNYVNMGNPTNLGLVGNNVFTLATWVYPTSTLLDGSLVAYGNAGVGRVVSINEQTAGNIFSVHYGNDHAYTTAYVLNQWQHVVLTYDGATEKLYVNGSDTGESWAPTTLALVTGDAFNIGRSTWNGITTPNGTVIKGVALWNRVLTSSEVATLYSQDNYPTSGLSAQYVLNEGAGTTTTDGSGNTNTGTLTGATLPTWVMATRPNLDSIVVVTPTITPFDSSAVTDSITIQRGTYNISVFDSSAATDVPVVVLVQEPVVFDSSAATDVIVQILQTSFVFVGEDSAVTEFVTVVIPGITQIINDASTVTDVPIVVLVQEPVVFDSSAATDVVTSIQVGFSTSTSDSSTVTDVIVQILITDFDSLFDASGVTDVPILKITDFVNVFDSSAATEFVTAAQGYCINVFDSSTATDVIVQILQTFFIAIFDSSAVTEFVSVVLPNLYISQFDSSAVNDSAQALSIYDDGTLFEASGVTDVITQILITDFVSLFDTSAVDDTSAVTNMLFMSVFDSSAVTDNIVQILNSYLPNVFDSSSVTDFSITALIGFGVISETSTVTDFVQILLPQFLINVFEKSKVTDIAIPLPFYSNNAPLYYGLDTGEISIMLGLNKMPTWGNNNRPQNPPFGAFGFNFDSSTLEVWANNWHSGG